MLAEAGAHPGVGRARVGGAGVLGPAVGGGASVGRLEYAGVDDRTGQRALAGAAHLAGETVRVALAEGGRRSFAAGAARERRAKEKRQDTSLRAAAAHPVETPCARVSGGAYQRRRAGATFPSSNVDVDVDLDFDVDVDFDVNVYVDMDEIR